MAAQLLSLQVRDESGNPVPAGRLDTFVSGTITRTPVYADEQLSTPLPNPVVTNQFGIAYVWLDADVIYDLRITNADGSTLYFDVPNHVPLVTDIFYIIGTEVETSRRAAESARDVAISERDLAETAAGNASDSEEMATQRAGEAQASATTAQGAQTAAEESATAAANTLAQAVPVITTERDNAVEAITTQRSNAEDSLNALITTSTAIETNINEDVAAALSSLATAQTSAEAVRDESQEARDEAMAARDLAAQRASEAAIAREAAAAAAAAATQKAATASQSQTAASAAATEASADAQEAAASAQLAQEEAVAARPALHYDPFELFINSARESLQHQADSISLTARNTIEAVAQGPQEISLFSPATRPASPLIGRFYRVSQEWVGTGQLDTDASEPVLHSLGVWTGTQTVYIPPYQGLRARDESTKARLQFRNQAQGWVSIDNTLSLSEFGLSQSNGELSAPMSAAIQAARGFSYQSETTAQSPVGTVIEVPFGTYTMSEIVEHISPNEEPLRLIIDFKGSTIIASPSNSAGLLALAYPHPDSFIVVQNLKILVNMTGQGVSNLFGLNGPGQAASSRKTLALRNIEIIPHGDGSYFGGSECILIEDNCNVEVDNVRVLQGSFDDARIATSNRFATARGIRLNRCHSGTFSRLHIEGNETCLDGAALTGEFVLSDIKAIGVNGISLEGNPNNKPTLKQNDIDIDALGRNFRVIDFAKVTGPALDTTNIGVGNDQNIPAQPGGPLVFNVSQTSFSENADQAFFGFLDDGNGNDRITTGTQVYTPEAKYGFPANELLTVEEVVENGHQFRRSNGELVDIVGPFDDGVLPLHEGPAPQAAQSAIALNVYDVWLQRCDQVQINGHVISGLGDSRRRGYRVIDCGDVDVIGLSGSAAARFINLAVVNGEQNVRFVSPKIPLVTQFNFISNDVGAIPNGGIIAANDEIVVQAATQPHLSDGATVWFTTSGFGVEGQREYLIKATNFAARRYQLFETQADFDNDIPIPLSNATGVPALRINVDSLPQIDTGSGGSATSGIGGPNTSQFGAQIIVADNGESVRELIGAQHEFMLDTRRFGVIPDDEASATRALDNVQAINAAITEVSDAGGGLVFLPPGEIQGDRFATADQTQHHAIILKPNVQLVGAGRNITRFKLRDQAGSTNGASCHVIYAPTANTDNVRLADFSIDGNRDNQTDQGDNLGGNDPAGILVNGVHGVPRDRWMVERIGIFDTLDYCFGGEGDSFFTNSTFRDIIAANAGADIFDFKAFGGSASSIMQNIWCYMGNTIAPVQAAIDLRTSWILDGIHVFGLSGDQRGVRIVQSEQPSERTIVKGLKVYGDGTGNTVAIAVNGEGHQFSNFSASRCNTGIQNRSRDSIFSDFQLKDNVNPIVNVEGNAATFDGVSGSDPSDDITIPATQVEDCIYSNFLIKSDDPRTNNPITFDDSSKGNTVCNAIVRNYGEMMLDDGEGNSLVNVDGIDHGIRVRDDRDTILLDVTRYDRGEWDVLVIAETGAQFVRATVTKSNGTVTIGTQTQEGGAEFSLNNTVDTNKIAVRSVATGMRESIRRVIEKYAV